MIIKASGLAVLYFSQYPPSHLSSLIYLLVIDYTANVEKTMRVKN